VNPATEDQPPLAQTAARAGCAPNGRSRQMPAGILPGECARACGIERCSDPFGHRMVLLVCRVIYSGEEVEVRHAAPPTSSGGQALSLARYRIRLPKCGRQRGLLWRSTVITDANIDQAFGVTSSKKLIRRSRDAALPRAARERQRIRAALTGVHSSVLKKGRAPKRETSPPFRALRHASTVMPPAGLGNPSHAARGRPP
jgi:hypothetical protein